MKWKLNIVRIWYLLLPVATDFRDQEEAIIHHTCLLRRHVTTVQSQGNMCSYVLCEETC